MPDHGKAAKPGVLDVRFDGASGANCGAAESEESRLRNAPENYTLMEDTPIDRPFFRPRNVLSFLLAIAILYLVFRQGFSFDWREVWSYVRGANVGLLVLAFAVFYSSFWIRALRWQALLGNVGYDRADGQPMPSISGLVQIMYLAWFVNCVTVARLGDFYRGYLLKRSAGVSFTVTLGTVLAERLLDLAVLAAMLSATILVAFHGTLPQEATSALAVALILSVAGAVGVLAMRSFKGAVERVLPARLRGYYTCFEHGTVDSFRRIPLLIIYSVVGWVIEGLTLYIVAVAVGAQVSISGAFVVALIASLLSTVPVTPSGLGFTEVGMVLMLQWVGLDPNLAGAVALLFRIINYWSIVFLGLVLYLFRANHPIKARLAS